MDDEDEDDEKDVSEQALITVKAPLVLGLANRPDFCRLHHVLLNLEEESSEVLVAL